MYKTLYVIAGFKHKASENQYKWMQSYFKSRGYIVEIPEIKWSNRVMSDYVEQFVDYYKKTKSDVNYVLGFSYGAMVALISAPMLRPDKLYLCSLSPYFNEDLDTLKPSWVKNIGHRRLADFSRYKASEIANQIKTPTVILYGSAEGKKYPGLKRRCEKTASILSNSRLIIVKDAPHQIDYPTYTEAIKAVV